jgi:hypothetical protein
MRRVSLHRVAHEHLILGTNLGHTVNVNMKAVKGQGGCPVGRRANGLIERHLVPAALGRPVVRPAQRRTSQSWR